MKRSELYEQILVRSRQESRDARRDMLRDLAVTALACLGWAFVGIACIAWSAHTNIMLHGRLAFFAGIGIGNGGVIFTLLAAYRRGEQRGDW